jgi:hypothetical protein
MSASSTSLERQEVRSGIFEEADRLDEDQIIAELKGKVIEEYFYEIPDKTTGKVTIGLSWAGTKWMAAKSADEGHPLSVEHVEIIESPDGLTYRAIATVKDLNTGQKLQGVYEQDRLLRRGVWEGKKKVGEEIVMTPVFKNGAKIGEEQARNQFAYTLAGSKAQRNGLRHFMPEPTIIATYKAWKEKRDKGKFGGKDVTAESKVSDVANPPPPPKGATVSKDQLEFMLQKEVKDGSIAVETAIEGGFIVKILKNLAQDNFKSIGDALKDYGATYDPKARGWTIAAPAAQA